MIHYFKAEDTNAKLNFDIQLKPDKQVYCFIGENACGKTNLLENMAKSVLYFHGAFLGDNEETLSKKGVGIKDEWRLNDIATNFIVNDFLFKNKPEDKNIPLGLISLQREGLLFNIPDFKEENEVKYIKNPIIFIAAKSRGHLENIGKINPYKQYTKAEAFKTFFDDLLIQVHGTSANSQSNVADWIFERLMVDDTFLKIEDKRKYQVQIIVELLEILEPEKFKGVSKKPLNEIFSLENQQVCLLGIPLDKLSTGYVSILKIFQEIIAGYAAWLGLDNNKDLKNAEGLVFIDEIEAHLHAKWQFEIIPLLKRFFPKTTFYIATHSPIIISSTKENEAYELIRTDNDVVAKNLGNPSNWYWNQLLMQAFHVPLENKYNGKNGNGMADIAKKTMLFSDKVKEYRKQPAEKLKTEIEDLYNEILPNFAENDPRLGTVNALKSMVI